ncbi:hypothetical protein [Reyranella sp.]
MSDGPAVSDRPPGAPNAAAPIVAEANLSALILVLCGAGPGSGN